jgi:hypothetical protein
MMGRRTAALLCVLLVHALVIYALLFLNRIDQRAPAASSFTSEPITLNLEPLEPERSPVVTPVPVVLEPPPSVARAPATEPPAGESAAITTAPPERVDWPIEAKKSAARVLAAESEAERVARMFAGPSGTWASLTKRQRSKLNKFRWKPGVDGLERDEQGNTIYHISDGCVLVNFLFIGCSIGKPKVNDDMFENMRLYFDEQRLPETHEGNGTEPEAVRPPKWGSQAPRQ